LWHQVGLLFISKSLDAIEGCVKGLIHNVTQVTISSLLLSLPVIDCFSVLWEPLFHFSQEGSLMKLRLFLYVWYYCYWSMWNLPLNCKNPKNLLQITIEHVLFLCSLHKLHMMFVHFHIFWSEQLIDFTGIRYWGSELKAVILLCVCAWHLIELSAMTCGILWLMPLLLEDKPNVVFQHDRAPPHIQFEVTAFLNRQLPELCFGWRGFTSWPLLSPALTLLDILLWGFVKDKFYILPIPNPTWLQQMCANSL